MANDHTVATGRIPTVKDIRTITVDLDDTLWEIRPVIRRAERRLYEWLGEHYPRITERFSVEEMRILRERVTDIDAVYNNKLTLPTKRIV